jgi:hypothetical protein
VRQAMLRLLVVATFIGIVPVTLHAQEGLRDRDRSLEASKAIAADLQKARAHAGPFYYLSSIEIADIGYNTTLFVPQNGGSDGIAIALNSPNRLYFLPTKKQVYSILVKPQYALATGGLDTGQFGYSTRVDAQYLLNHLYLDIYGTQADELRATTAEINRIATTRERSGGVAGEIRYSSRTSATFNAVSRRYEFPQSRLQPNGVALALLDRREQNYRLSLLHKTFPLTSLFAAAELGNYTFSHTTYKDARRRYLGGGAIRESGRGSTRLELGVAQLNFANTNNISNLTPNYHGAVGNLSTSYQVSGRTNLQALASRDLDFSIFAGNNYYVIDHGSATLSYIATKHLTLNVTSSLVRDRYPVATLGANGLFARRLDTATFNSVGWLYTLHRLRGGFDVGYYERTSNLSYDESSGIRVVLHLSFTP